MRRLVPLPTLHRNHAELTRAAVVCHCDRARKAMREGRASDARTELLDALRVLDEGDRGTAA